MNSPRLRLAAVILAAAVPAGSGASCLEPGSGIVSITGTLVQKPLGTPAKLTWQIRLESAMCVRTTAAEGLDDPAMEDVRVVHLLVTPQRMQSDFYLVGKRVTATGFVSTRVQPHEPVAASLDVKSLEAAR